MSNYIRSYFDSLLLLPQTLLITIGLIHRNNLFWLNDIDDIIYLHCTVHRVCDNTAETVEATVMKGRYSIYGKPQISTARIMLFQDIQISIFHFNVKTILITWIGTLLFCFSAYVFIVCLTWRDRRKNMCARSFQTRVARWTLIVQVTMWWTIVSERNFWYTFQLPHLPLALQAPTTQTQTFDLAICVFSWPASLAQNVNTQVKSHTVRSHTSGRQLPFDDN